MDTRVLVVDDATIFRRAIVDVLGQIPGVSVVGTAANGKTALARLQALQPDIVTLDIEMPEMNGIEVLDAMRVSGVTTTAIVLSSQTVRGSGMTVRALEAGAFDFITKPEGGSQQESLSHLRRSLEPIIQAIVRRRESSVSAKPKAILQASTSSASPVAASRPRQRGLDPIVLIGVSTGGPNALAEVLPGLPQKLGAPIFIVQHMPAHFTEALAQRLDGKSAIRVKEAQHGEIAQADCAYLAPGGRHLKLSAGLRGEVVVQITDDPPENNCRPAVDYLFRSVALNFPGRAVAAILTGMGTDGTAGMRMLRRTGSFNIAQDEATCVVYGMPREAVEAGVVDCIVPLKQIAEAIRNAVAEVRK